MKKSFLTFLLIIQSFATFAQWHWSNPLPQGNKLNSVCFTDSLTGYAVGSAGTIMKTTDGSITWEILNFFTDKQLSSVFFTNENTGYAVGGKLDLMNNLSEGIVFKTNDSGTTWYDCSPDSANVLSAVYS